MYNNNGKLKLDFNTRTDAEMEVLSDKYFKDGKWVNGGLLRVIKKLFGNRTQLPSIFYGNNLFKFYTHQKSSLYVYQKYCEDLLAKPITGKFVIFFSN